MTFTFSGSGHIGFCAYRPPTDYSILQVVLLKNLIPISNAPPPPPPPHFPLSEWSLIISQKPHNSQIKCFECVVT